MKMRIWIERQIVDGSMGRILEILASTQTKLILLKMTPLTNILLPQAAQVHAPSDGATNSRSRMCFKTPHYEHWNQHKVA